KKAVIAVAMLIECWKSVLDELLYVPQVHRPVWRDFRELKGLLHRANCFFGLDRLSRGRTSADAHRLHGLTVNRRRLRRFGLRFFDPRLPLVFQLHQPTAVDLFPSDLTG